MKHDDEDDSIYTGAKDSKGLAHGRGTQTYPSGDVFMGHFIHGEKCGRGTFHFEDGSCLCGQWISDSVEGRGIYVYEDGGWLEGEYSGGMLNGPADEYDSNGYLLFEGQYRDNRRWGHCRVFRPDGGCLEGTVDEQGAMTGREILYRFPDSSTVLVGRFDGGIMVKAWPGSVQGNTRHGAPRVTVNKTWGVPYSYDPSTRTHLSTHPLVPDPYEQERVYVKQSEIPGAGEGLFALADVDADVVVAFYNGIRLTHTEVDCRDWEENSNTISLDESVVIDVPAEWASLHRYCASLGHKANHSFTNNAKYDTYEHPRFGAIKCIRTIRPIAKDEEVTVFYGYNHHGNTEKDTRAPDWYLEQQREADIPRENGQ